MSTEEQARAAVIAWAKEFFFSDVVKMKSLTYDKDEMNWTATLVAGPAQSTDTVTFLMDDVYGFHPQTIGGEEAEAAIERNRKAWEADMRDMAQIREEWRSYRLAGGELMAEYTVKVHFIDGSEKIVPAKDIKHVGEEGAQRGTALVDSREVPIYQRSEPEWGPLWYEQEQRPEPEEAGGQEVN